MALQMGNAVIQPFSEWMKESNSHIFTKKCLDTCSI